MKIARSVLIVFLLLMPAFACADDALYRYPLDDSFAATILGTPQNLRPEPGGKVPVKTMILETDLKKPEIFFYDHGLRYTVAFQDRKAPLIFLIAGTGSGSKSPKVLAFMENLYHAGELDYLRRVLGPRIKIFPGGGHLGNLEHRDNTAFLIDRLRSATW